MWTHVVAVRAPRGTRSDRVAATPRPETSEGRGHAPTAETRRLGYREKDIFPRYTLAFAIPIAWIFFPLLDALPFVGRAKKILRRDLAVNAYRLEAWVVVDSTVQLVPMLVQSFMYPLPARNADGPRGRGGDAATSRPARPADGLFLRGDPLRRRGGAAATPRPADVLDRRGRSAAIRGGDPRRRRDRSTIPRSVGTSSSSSR